MIITFKSVSHSGIQTCDKTTRGRWWQVLDPPHCESEWTINMIFYPYLYQYRKEMEEKKVQSIIIATTVYARYYINSAMPYIYVVGGR